jgi:hypothetical protein
MPKEFVERVFLNADPPYVTRAEDIQKWVARIATPPYVTNKAVIQHRIVDRTHDRFITLASDGLTDLLNASSPVLTPEHIGNVAKAIGEVGEGRTPLSSQLLRYAMGGSDMAKASQYLTVDMDGEAWMDDTTVVCLRL